MKEEIRKLKEPDEDEIEDLDETEDWDKLEDLDEIEDLDDFDDLEYAEGIADLDRLEGIAEESMEAAEGEAAEKEAPAEKRKRKMPLIVRIFLRFLLIVVSTVLMLFVTAYATLWIFCKGPSKAARDLFVSTILETGQMKFLASWYFSKEEILEITERNAMSQIEENVDTGLISVDNGEKRQDGDFDVNGFDVNGIEIIELSGRSFYAKLMIINDPSRVKLATIYPWSSLDQEKKGKTLEQLVTGADAVAGINGGEYYSEGNWGGRPKGVVVCDGEIQYNSPQTGDVLVGFTEENILMIVDVGGKSADEVKKLIEEDKIRDAVSFKDINDGDSNHFTKLIINGKARELSGSGSGANPRTAIGQCADGTVLFLVTDGRGSAGHIGATAADLINIMIEYGAVNAANLDGGSSSAMYYEDAYEMTSVTLYYATSSWRLPTAFVVEKGEAEE